MNDDDVTVLTYDLYRIAWDDGATWSGYGSYGEAALLLRGRTSDRTGRVERRTFEILVNPAHPGILSDTWVSRRTEPEWYCPAEDTPYVAVLPEDVPAEFEIQPLDRIAALGAKRVAVCGTCARAWDDGVSTAWTPTPSGRCPFEYFHDLEEVEEPT